jgi:exoribonuclease R
MYDLFEPAENKYFIRSSTRTIKLGEQVKVQIVKTDIELRQIDLRLIQ